MEGGPGVGDLVAVEAAWAAGDVNGVIAHLSAAIRELTAAADVRGAAMACARLGDVYANQLGNSTAGRAWFARATRLVADEPPCIEQGWVAVAAMGCDVDDPAELLAKAELALDRARRFGDLNLEAKALADGGLAHVRAGRIAHGMAMLDEAMALVCGPADDIDAASKGVCSFFTACYHTGAFERAASWSDLLRHHGLLGPDAGPGAFLRSHCDTLQATFLFELGRWGEAEAVLGRAIDDFEAAAQSPAWHPAIALAGIRIAQGRLAEAEELLLGKDAAVEALLPTARLHLARGDHELARAAARRGLRAMGDDRLRAAELLAVVVEGELAGGDLAAATDAADELDRRLGALDVPALRGRADVARARVLVAEGRLEAAEALLDATLDRLDPAALPWLRTATLVELARVRSIAGRTDAAAVAARAASTAMATLDVGRPPEQAAVLGSLLTPVDGRPGGAATVVRLVPAARWWDVADATSSVRVPDSKGLRYLAELVAHPFVERHALDLVDRLEGVDGGGVDRRHLGDAGELADSRARSAYRHRIEALRGEVGDALAVGAVERAESLQREIDQLVEHLAAAFGLGGRARRASSVAEKARLNVTRALRAAIARLADAVPGPGAALDRRVRTGLYCAYEPATEDGVLWIVQS